MQGSYTGPLHTWAQAKLSVKVAYFRSEVAVLSLYIAAFSNHNKNYYHNNTYINICIAEFLWVAFILFRRPTGDIPTRVIPCRGTPPEIGQ